MRRRRLRTYTETGVYPEGISNMACLTRPIFRRGGLGLVLAAAVTVATFATASPLTAPAQATASVATAPPADRFRGFVLNNGRYTAFDASGTTTKTVAGGVNDRGQIVGGYTDAAGEHGFLRDVRGRVTRIDVPDARSTSAAKINDLGQVVGYYTQTGLLEDPNPERHSFVLDRGRFVRISAPGAVDTQATGINNRGQVVGQFLDKVGSVHGFLWQRGRFQIIDAPGAAGTSLTDINDHEQFLGFRLEPDGTFHAFVLDRDRYTLFAAPGAALTVPFDINNRGQIVGAAYRVPAAIAAQGFLLARGVRGAFTLVNVPGATSTLVTGISDPGLIVGAYQNASHAPSPQRSDPSPVDQHAWQVTAVG
jgi:probable HAF family extracellular repeat protein/YD repeat-containing protein